MKSIYIVVVTAMLALLAVYFLSPWPVALGTVAAWVTTGSFFLQVLHIVRNRDTKALSLGMWSALFFGVSCWTWYGYRVHDVPVMTANGLTALLAFSVIMLKLYHERPGKTAYAANCGQCQGLSYGRVFVVCTPIHQVRHR